LLRRIPAVKWAFTRLRPVQHGGSIDATPAAADVSSVIVQDVAVQDIAVQEVAAQDAAEAASTQGADISTASGLGEAAAPSAQDDAAISVIAESPPAAPTEAGAGDDSSRETSADIGPVVEEEASAAAIETATEDAPEPAISNDPLPVAAEAVGTVETSPSPGDVERDPLDAAALVVDDARASDVIVDVEPTVDAPCVTSADAEVLAQPASETDFDSDPSPDDAGAIEPAVADGAAPVAAMVIEHGLADTASVITEIAPALVSPAPDVGGPPKVRARAAEPADRTALIRQRWAESGIRMWNPRLHGTGEATLNIQGSVGLLPPAPGETMPRYDKLEFKMLGGQIVCEGVIVEAPAQASQRSFTRLAEPAKLERVREPARERQAALA